eukprot:scaffold3307_cov265-Pinguiococcus_pyrenoidosus.AAC.24
MTESQEPKEVDLYRDTPVRLLGYANEVGEAFRYQLPGWVLPSYGVSIAYVLADTHDKYSKDSSANKWMTAVDTMVWQGLASVAIPGFTIHTIVKSTKAILPKASGAWARTWLPTAAGLGAIPFIVEPIDELVTLVMDKVSPARKAQED